MILPLRTQPAAPERRSPEQRPTAGQLWAETAAALRTVLVALALALLIRVVFYQPFTIPSASMEPGLVEGDYILVSKFSYGWSRASIPFSPPAFSGRLFGRSPSRGDVIVFKSAADGQTAVIKRVIGRPGDRVQLRGGVVLVNGGAVPRTPVEVLQAKEPAAEVFRERKPGGETYLTLDQGPGREGDDTEVFVVPADHYFVLGDNRDNSLDSRWPVGFGMGYVPAENIVGEAQLVLLSWRAGASLLKPWTWFDLRPDRLLRRIA